MLILCYCILSLILASILKNSYINPCFIFKYIVTLRLIYNSIYKIGVLAQIGIFKNEELRAYVVCSPLMLPLLSLFTLFYIFKFITLTFCSAKAETMYLWYTCCSGHTELSLLVCVPRCPSIGPAGKPWITVNTGTMCMPEKEQQCQVMMQKP